MTSSGYSCPRGPAQASKPIVCLPITPPDTFSRAASPFSTSWNAISQNFNMMASIKSPAESSGSQGPVTMQTRVAVRDATPHRFQIVSLREANDLDNIPELHALGKKGMKSRTQVLQSVNWQPSPIPSYSFAPRSRSNLSTLPQIGANNSPDKPHMVLIAKKTSAQREEITSNNAEYHSLKNHHRPKPSMLGKPHTPNLTKAHGKQPALEANLKVTDRCTCHIVSMKPKFRACSEDLTRHLSKSVHNRRYERLFPPCPRDDQSWYATKRHAIYSDTLNLPLLFSESEFHGPQQVSRTPQSYFCHRCTKPRYLEEILGSQGNMSSKILTRSQSEQSFALRKFLTQDRPSTQPSLHSPVPHLRLSRNARGSSAFRTIVKSTLSAVHERPLRHPKIILDLLIQLEQATEEWNSLQGEKCTTKW